MQMPNDIIRLSHYMCAHSIQMLYSLALRSSYRYTRRFYFRASVFKLHWTEKCDVFTGRADMKWAHELFTCNLQLYIIFGNWISCIEIISKIISVNMEPFAIYAPDKHQHFSLNYYENVCSHSYRQRCIRTPHTQWNEEKNRIQMTEAASVLLKWFNLIWPWRTVKWTVKFAPAKKLNTVMMNEIWPNCSTFLHFWHNCCLKCSERIHSRC